jgi:putative component of membrane protein insertase Oxa1/YidC/SpoIIIJ protein YidD
MSRVCSISTRSSVFGGVGDCKAYARWMIIDESININALVSNLENSGDIEVFRNVLSQVVLTRTFFSNRFSPTCSTSSLSLMRGSEGMFLKLVREFVGLNCGHKLRDYYAALQILESKSSKRKTNSKSKQPRFV